MIGLGLGLTALRGGGGGGAPISAMASAMAWWDSLEVADGAVTTLPDRIGQFDLTAIGSTAEPNAAGGVITFDGVNDAMRGPVQLNPGVYALPGTQYVREYTLPNAFGGDAGQGFSIAGFAQDTDGTWWAVNGGKNRDGVSQSGDSGLIGDVRKQSVVHLSADFSTNLSEFRTDTLWGDAAGESPQAIAVDVANDWLWVLDPTALRIRCVQRNGTRISANDITLPFIAGALAFNPAGTEMWVMERSGSTQRLIRIPTASPHTPTVDVTLSVNSRGDHIFEYGGLLYISYGNNASQGQVVVLDAANQQLMGRVMLPYPDGPNGLVGVEGIWIGPNGRCLMSHNGYFHYGDPADPVAPLQFPITNVVVEYTLPTVATKDFDLFFLGRMIGTGGNRLAFEFGANITNPQFPSFGLYLNPANGRLDLRANTTSGASAQVGFTVGLSTTFLAYVAVRAGSAEFFVNGVSLGSATLSSDGNGFIGPAHRPIMGDVLDTNRAANMEFLSGGVFLGSVADRQRVEGTVAWRHGLASLLPVGHPYKTVNPSA